eukprot:1150648_1
MHWNLCSTDLMQNVSNILALITMACHSIIFIISVLIRVKNPPPSAVLLIRVTKNGDYSVVRYYFDTEQNDWPNTPVRMGWTAANRLKDIGLVNKKDKYKRNGRGGQEEWTGTIERLKLSEVWDRSSPSERQCIAEFIADKRGVDWRTFLIRTGDYLNAVQLGLVGPNECRYNVSLTQAINGSPSAQPSASGQLRINAHPSDGRGYLVEE